MKEASLLQEERFKQAKLSIAEYERVHLINERNLDKLIKNAAKTEKKHRRTKNLLLGSISVNVAIALIFILK